MITHTHTHTQSNAYKVNAGQVVAKKAHPGVNSELLADILKWQKQGLDWIDILNRLRLRTVPPGYTYHPWKSGIASS